jgi:hypothetical protein
VFGQKTYLRIPQACLVHWSEIDPAHKADFVRIGEQTGVVCCTLRMDSEGNYDPTELASPAIDIDESLQDGLVTHAWYQLIASRLAFASFAHLFKSHAEVPEFHKARTIRPRNPPILLRNTPFGSSQGVV